MPGISDYLENVLAASFDCNLDLIYCQFQGELNQPGWDLVPLQRRLGYTLFFNGFIRLIQGRQCSE
jgi:hypothetical protein